MIYTVTNDPRDLKIFPENELAEIAQNIYMILITPKFSVPLDRAFGIDYNILDSPINAAQSKMTAEIVSAVNTFEPRAKVTAVRYSGDFDGVLKISVDFVLREVRD